MRTKPKLLLVFLCIFCLSCSNKYQVFETSSPDAKIENNFFVFENTDVKITYDLWTEGGKMNFMIHNKTENPIYIDWDKSHLIYNGISHEYWIDMEEANSLVNSWAAGSGFTNSMLSLFSNYSYGNTQGRKTTAVSTSKYKPKRIIHLPSKSSLSVSRFSLVTAPIFDCDFNTKKLNNRKPVTKSYARNDSPVNFRNYITYSLKEIMSNEKIIDNQFYISNISFLTEDGFNGKSQNVKSCTINGSAKSTSVYSYPYKKANSFFITLKK